jgi:hypothetical protein
MQAAMERNFEEMRRKGLQQDLFKGKLKPDDVKKMGYTDDQVREIISGKKLLPGESWGDLSGVGFPKIKILGKGELPDDEVNRIATERKKRGEAEKSAQQPAPVQRARQRPRRNRTRTGVNSPALSRSLER